MESYLFTIDNRNDFLSEISRAYVANAFKKTGIPKSINIGELIIDKFSDGEYSPNFKHSIRGCRIYLVGSTNTPDNILRMLLTIDAAKRASVREIMSKTLISLQSLAHLLLVKVAPRSFLS